MLACRGNARRGNSRGNTRVAAMSAVLALEADAGFMGTPRMLQKYAYNVNETAALGTLLTYLLTC